MKEKILEKSTVLFLDLGFKNVTMDDIAKSLSISKRTIYAYFKNKNALVDSVVSSIFSSVCIGIEEICKSENYNPIEEIYEIRNFVRKLLRDEKSFPQYQLKKYYPEICNSLRRKQFTLLQDSLLRNLDRGIKLSIFRKKINAKFISIIYLHGVQGIKDKDLFPVEEFEPDELWRYFFDYHLQGICTKKGLEILENHLKKNNLDYR